jgi:hypothetical protein
MLLLYPRYKALGWDNVASVKVDGEVVRSLLTQIKALYPTLPEGARLLLLHESDDPVWDQFAIIVRLDYRDQTIQVDRARKMERKIVEREMAAYDHLLDYRAGRLVASDIPPDPRLKPRVLETAQGPDICHGDWSPLTGKNPARAGDTLIVKATGLGPTSPDVAVGRPFPADPLAPVSCRISARLNGKKAETPIAIGWPQTIDTYRVDVIVPKGIKPGMAKLELWVRGVPAPPVQLPVR